MCDDSWMSVSGICGHQTRLCTLWTQDIGSVRDESFADECRCALRARETVVVPMSIFERDKFCTTNTGDRLHASITSFRKQLAETIGTVRLFVLGRESLTGERCGAICASEAFAMPWLILVGDTASADYLSTFAASRRKLLLIARRTIDFLVFRYKAFGTDRRFAQRTAKALVVPLFAFVFHLFHAGFEYLAASVASRRKCLIVAVRAEDAIILAAKWFVDQRDLAHIA